MGNGFSEQVLRSSQPRHDTKFIFLLLISIIFFFFYFFFFISFSSFFYKSTISSLPERDAAIHDVESRANSSHHQHPLEPSLSLNTLSLSLSLLLYFFSRSLTRTLSLFLTSSFLLVLSIHSFFSRRFFSIRR